MRLALALLALLLPPLAGCSGPKQAPDSPPDENAEARKLCIAKCARCHKLYDPARYTDSEWQGWMDKMGRKAKLKTEQKDLLTRYVDAVRAKDARNAGGDG